MKITPEIFHAYLKCPTKCWLRAKGESPSGNPYAEWVKTQNEHYRATETERLVAASYGGEVTASPESDNVKTAKWRLATGMAAQAQMDSCVMASEVHAVERIPSDARGKAAQFIPIRFNFTNKLGKDDKLLAGFDAFVLSETLGRDVHHGKIIHGDNHAALKVKTPALVSEARKCIKKIAKLLSSPAPPDIVLNRHCAECEFQSRCRNIAIEKDDLSLLGGMSAKERDRHRAKGIFTVTQLSYTFRPRRTPKRAKNPAKPRYLALQALAIRENTVYIHGTPILPKSRTHVYLDIEGLPDRDYYYLIGAFVVSDGHETFHSFWADTQADEPCIFAQFIETVMQFEDFQIFHFGDYDVAALKHVKSRLSESQQSQLDMILGKCTNVLSAIYPHVYFPTYSNSLKNISRIIGVDCAAHYVTGLDSIAWRTEWERLHGLELKTRLLDYNRADCVLLRRLHDFVIIQHASDLEHRDGCTVNVIQSSDIITERPYWQTFCAKKYALEDLQKITKCAYFDYQREKVLVRTHRQFRVINRRHRKRRKTNLRPNETILMKSQRCPQCQSRKIKALSEVSHILVDLKFSRRGVKKWVTEIRAERYLCSKCGARFCSEKRGPKPKIFGHGVVSWALYLNVGCGLNMGRVAKSLGDVFKVYLDKDALYRCRRYAVDDYEKLYDELKQSVLREPVLHVDETTVHLKGQKGYVWVFTTTDKVYYFYRPSREAAFLQEMLAPFSGILVSDFYTAYDSLPCAQQKCLAHIVRDIDDALLKNPLDIEFKGIATAFGSLLMEIVRTVDRYGLKKRHLRKHKREVFRFLDSVGSRVFVSDLAGKFKKRFQKSGLKMFTFLDHDGVPWNNNNAERAIKRFAKYRRDANGKFTEKSLREYLVMASVLETCEFNNLSVLDFLLSKETTMSGLFRMAGRTAEPSPDVPYPQSTQSLELPANGPQDSGSLP